MTRAKAGQRVPARDVVRETGNRDAVSAAARVRDLEAQVYRLAQANRQLSERETTLRAIFEARGATPDKKITVYCNTGFRSAHAYLAMRLLGYPDVRNYVGSWQEWGNREGLPIARPE